MPYLVFIDTPRYLQGVPLASCLRLKTVRYLVLGIGHLSLDNDLILGRSQAPRNNVQIVPECAAYASVLRKAHDTGVQHGVVLS